MNIGQAAAASGISAKMIRHYESIKLITPAERSEAGYRLYTKSDIDILSFIRRGRDLGFSIEQIRELLNLRQNPARASADVKKIALEHVRELEAKMQQLQEMTNILRDLAQHCQGNDKPDCPILSTLSSEDIRKMHENEPRKGDLLHQSY